MYGARLTPGRRRTLRLVALFSVVALLIVIGALSGARARFTVENLRLATTASGAIGVVVFTIAFCVGELLYVPGLVFIVAGVLAWGRVWGSAIAFAAALVSVSLTFAVVRGAAGKALGESQRPFIQRALARLDAHPIRTVFVLRLFFQVSPPLNYALALSSIRFRDFLVGTALGLAPPVVVAALFVDALARYLAR